MKKRVLIVAPYFYPEGGGLERYAFEMARNLSKEHEVFVLCMTRENETEELIGNIKIRRVKPLFILSNTPVSFRFIVEVAREIKNSDLVIAHTPVPFAADVAVFFAKLRALPVVLVYHTVGLKKGSRKLDALSELYSKTIEKLTLKGVELISVSRTVWKYLRERGYHSRIVHPPLVIHSEPFKRERKKVILFVGQLGKYHRFKNLDVLLLAFSRVHRKFEGWKLWVVGDGDMKEGYKNLSTQLGIKDKTMFLGRIDDSHYLRRIYSSVSLLVLPSAFESFGMVVPEALSAGVPVVVSSNVGAVVLVNSKNGRILKEPSVEEIEKTLSELLGNPKLLRKMSVMAHRSIGPFLKQVP